MQRHPHVEVVDGGELVGRAAQDARLRRILAAGGVVLHLEEERDGGWVRAVMAKQPWSGCGVPGRPGL